jgi:hypothetical protein
MGRTRSRKGTKAKRSGARQKARLRTHANAQRSHPGAPPPPSSSCARPGKSARKRACRRARTPRAPPPGIAPARRRLVPRAARLLLPGAIRDGGAAQLAEQRVRQAERHGQRRRGRQHLVRVRVPKRAAVAGGCVHHRQRLRAAPALRRAAALRAEQAPLARPAGGPTRASGAAPAAHQEEVPRERLSPGEALAQPRPGRGRQARAPGIVDDQARAGRHAQQHLPMPRSLEILPCADAHTRSRTAAHLALGGRSCRDEAQPLCAWSGGHTPLSSAPFQEALDRLHGSCGTPSLTVWLQGAPSGARLGGRTPWCASALCTDAQQRHAASSRPRLLLWRSRGSGSALGFALCKQSLRGAVAI